MQEIKDGPLIMFHLFLALWHINIFHSHYFIIFSVDVSDSSQNIIFDQALLSRYIIEHLGDHLA